MQHGKALSPAVNEWIRVQLQAWLDADPTRRRAHLAAKLKVSPAHMTNVLTHGLLARVPRVPSEFTRVEITDAHRVAAVAAAG